MSHQITAWDNTSLQVAHSTPGDTTIERLGMAMQAFVTVTGSLLIPADMDPTSTWAVDALTGELATKYRIEYRAHVSGIGWQPYVADGAVAGTTGQSRAKCSRTSAATLAAAAHGGRLAVSI